MMNVLLRVSDTIDAIRQRAGRNVFWLALLAVLAAVAVVPMYLFQEPGPVTVRPPVSSGEVRSGAPAAPVPSAPVTQAPAAAPVVTPPPPAAPATSAAPGGTAASPQAQLAPQPPTPAAPVAVPPPAPKAPAAEAPKPAPAASAPKPAAIAAAPKPAPAPPPASKQPLVLSDARKPEAPPTPASAEPQRLYQVQLGAFAAQQRAHRLAQQAAKEGFPAIVMQVTVAGGKVLHRVRLKASLPREQAEALQAEVKQKIPTLDPILAPAR